jgi:hypothetical protein
VTVRDGTGRGVEAVAARAEVVLQCASPREAQVLWDALSADDPGSVEGRVEGDRLVILVGPSSMASMRTTLDDLLACAQAASCATVGHGTGTRTEIRTGTGTGTGTGNRGVD